MSLVRERGAGFELAQVQVRRDRREFGERARVETRETTQKSAFTAQFRLFPRRPEQSSGERMRKTRRRVCHGRPRARTRARRRARRNISRRARAFESRGVPERRQDSRERRRDSRESERRDSRERGEDSRETGSRERRRAPRSRRTFVRRIDVRVRLRRDIRSRPRFPRRSRRFVPPPSSGQSEAAPTGTRRDDVVVLADGANDVALFE